MLIKAILLACVWATTFQEGKSLYFSQTDLTTHMYDNWEVHRRVLDVHAILEPGEAGVIKYAIPSKVAKNCPVLDVSPSGQITIQSNATVPNSRQEKKCSYLLEAELTDMSGMKKAGKVNTTLYVIVTGGERGENASCDQLSQQRMCFGGMMKLSIQVMENSEKVSVAYFGQLRQSCSLGLNFVVVPTANDTEGIFSIKDNEDELSLSELWISSDLDRETTPSYNFSVVCSITLKDGVVNQFKLPGKLTVLDQDDNFPTASLNSTSTFRFVTISLHSAKNAAPKERLEPEGGHKLLSFADRDTTAVNHYDIQTINDTKNLLSISISSEHELALEKGSPPLTYVVLKAERKTATMMQWEGSYCVLVNVTDTTYVGGGDAKMSFNICLHHGFEPTTTKLPLLEHGKEQCGTVCRWLGGLFICIVVFTVIGVCFRRNYKMTKRKSVKPPVVINPNGIHGVPVGYGIGNGSVISTGMDYIGPGPENNALTNGAEYFTVGSKWEVPRSALIVEDVLGEGEFGRVLKARFHNPNDPPGAAGEDFGRFGLGAGGNTAENAQLQKCVLPAHTERYYVGIAFVGDRNLVNTFHRGRMVVAAVKTLKDNEVSGRSCRQEFMAEFSLLKQVDHHNVIKLLGACTSGPGPYYLIMEFAEFGSLRSFLRKCRRIESIPSLPSTSSTAPMMTNFPEATFAGDRNGWDPRFTVTPKDILGFSWQIAKGMAYLSDMKMVHRDLAARNVLLASAKVCKISDFGLTRDIYVDDAYKKKSKDRVPVKWLAPECLADELYTTKSDVWAYGVLLWELANMGASPYPGIPSEQLYFLLKTGYRMPQPTNCSFQFYGLMRQCWADEPAGRPSFRQLVAALGVLLEDGIDYIQLNIPSVSNPAYDFYDADSIPTGSPKAILADSASHPLFRATDTSAHESDVSMEHLRLIDHEISTCEGPSSETSTEYNNTFVVHTYVNNEPNKEELQTVNANSSQGTHSAPISISTYESPIKLKPVSLARN